MIGSVLIWWAASSLLGLIAAPIAWRLFSRLPDRGYGLSRILGIALASYILWLGATVGALRNSLGGALGAVVLVAGLSLWAGAGRWREIRRWFRSHWRTILLMELLFLVVFFLWAFVRANDPNIDHTEQRMDLAFLNAILSSETFPPRDPWLSGYAISYYYFGYVQMALLTRLTAVSSGVAFNLTNSLWFGLSVLGIYSLLYNLLARQGRRTRFAAPLLGPLFVFISGNIEGFLEFLHVRHFLWRQDTSGEMTSSFWRWLNLKNLVNPPLAEKGWIPTRNWWWWRASRVVNDINLKGISIEVIDEFPFFSFLLADNHPHFLALPFVLMILGFALHVYLAGKRGSFQLNQVKLSPTVRTVGVIGALLALLILVSMRGASAAAEGMTFMAMIVPILKTVVLGMGILGLLAVFILLVLGFLPSAMPSSEFWFGAWLFGGLLFINTWDFPMYFSILLAVILWAARADPMSLALKRVVWTAIGITMTGVLFFLPWYPGFASQAGGILPNLIFPTRLPHFLVLFATAFIPILVWLIWKVQQDWRSSEGRWLAMIAVGLPLILLLLSWALGAVMAIYLQKQDPMLLNDTLTGMGATSISDVIVASLGRLTQSWTALALGATIGMGGLLLRRSARRPEQSKMKGDSVWPFVVILIGVGSLLVLGPEFLYLKDQFNTRMNTIFKFYFTAWILLGVAAAYVTSELWPRRLTLGGALRMTVVLPLVLGLFYPVLATWTKTNGFNPAEERTLDGTAYLARYYPSDYAAIQWINDRLEGGVISEAIGGSYTYFARVSTHTYLDTVLGWPGHESQWRGGAREMGSRAGDVQRLYQTRDWMEAQLIVDQYQIDYVYVGPLERTTYDPDSRGMLDEEKFMIFMDVIFQNEEVRIYARRSEAGP